MDVVQPLIVKVVEGMVMSLAMRGGLAAIDHCRATSDKRRASFE